MGYTSWNKTVKSSFVVLVGSALALMLTVEDRALGADIVLSRLTVDTLADGRLNDGSCTLREAILNANADNESGSTDCARGNGTDTIIFSVSGTITPASALPTITSDVVINGAGSITVNGNQAVRIFAVAPGASLALFRLTVMGGRCFTSFQEPCSDASGLSFSSQGGGVLNGGTLIVASSTFSSNGAVGGGAIFNSGRAVISNTMFSSNYSVIGGGISNAGFLSVAHSTFLLNSGEGAGGGIANTGTANITNSVFSRNGPAEDFGGGALWNCGAVSIANSTFAENFIAGGRPGGGAGISSGGLCDFVSLNITNSTFTKNSAAFGAAIRVNTGSATITNSIISNNGFFPVPGTVQNCFGVVLDGGNNIEDSSTCGFTTDNNSQPNTDPRLDPAGFLDLGGHTRVIALCTGVNTLGAGCAGPSPAIDAANNARCATPLVNNVDQRGFVRSVDGDGDGTATCDIGAFEAGAAQPPVVNGQVRLTQIPSTFSTTSDVTGCPSGFIGKFTFEARLTVNDPGAALFGLMASVRTLTNGNLLLNSDGEPRGVGGVLTIARTDQQYAEGRLSSPGFLDVPFTICLKDLNNFTFLVDVLGVRQ